MFKMILCYPILSSKCNNTFAVSEDISATMPPKERYERGKNPDPRPIYLYTQKVFLFPDKGRQQGEVENLEGKVHKKRSKRRRRRWKSNEEKKKIPWATEDGKGREPDPIDPLSPFRPSPPPLPPPPPPRKSKLCCAKEKKKGR